MLVEEAAEGCVRGGRGHIQKAVDSRTGEELAQQRDPMVDNLIGVVFLEAAPWGRLGVRSLLGSATRALVAQINPDHFDTKGL